MIKFQVILANPSEDTMLWNAGLPDAPSAPHQGVSIPEVIVSETGKGPLAVTLIARERASWFPSQLQVVADFWGEDRAIYAYNWIKNTTTRTGMMEPEPTPVPEPPTPEPKPKPEPKPESKGCPTGYITCRTCYGEGVVPCSKCDGTGCVKKRRRRGRRFWRRR